MASEGRSGRQRRLPIGAEVAGSGVDFRVWAPGRKKVVAVTDSGEHPLAEATGGYFSAFVDALGAGARYRFRLDDEPTLYPDPASRFQPAGPHGPSEIVDPESFRWTSDGWRGSTLEGQVVYEMHVATFTPEGTWKAAEAKLPFLRDLGVTLIEMMPVNEFPGRFGWGYDGVNLFAPTRLYGRPDDLRHFVDAAHGHGIGVILDVVYNHIGPDGNYLPAFMRSFFTGRHANEWGEAINFDGPGSEGVREFFIANAALWISEYRFDGLRLDATQAMHDSSPDHVLAAIVRGAREAAGTRPIVVIAENEEQETRLVRPPEQGGYGIDAVWNDDFHHSAIVALSGQRQAYYSDYAGAPQEFVSAAKYGYLFQGQRYGWQGKPRGTPGLDIEPARFVTFIENHDQVANSIDGRRWRFSAHPGDWRALTALLLLGPGTPMLFQGEEFGSSAPFAYFADHEGELADAVRNGRRRFLGQFPNVAGGNGPLVPDPGDPATFERCRLDWSECEQNAATVALHRDLIRLRRSDPAFAARPAVRADGAVIGSHAFLLRFLPKEGGDRLLIVNLGPDLGLGSIADPLAAPPAGMVWRLLWSSEDASYGGAGTPPVLYRDGWRLPAHAAVVMAATEAAAATEPAGSPAAGEKASRG